MPLNDALRILFQQKNKENIEIQQKAKAMLRKEGHEEKLREEESRISIIPSRIRHIITRE